MSSEPMPDGHPRYGLFKVGTIAYLGDGRWYKPSTGSRGSSVFTCDNDVNPVCGCHLASQCALCRVCVSCQGCYCDED